MLLVLLVVLVVLLVVLLRCIAVGHAGWLADDEVNDSDKLTRANK